MDGYAKCIEGQQGLEDHLSTKNGLLDFVEQLRGGAKHRWPLSCVQDVVRALVQIHGTGVYQTYTLPDNPELTLHRVRKLETDNEPFTQASQLGSLSAEKTKEYGRCHIPNEPVCYCSLYEDIALAEKNVETGQRYAIATYKLAQGLIVLPVGEFDFFRRTGTTYLGSAIPDTLKHYKAIQDDSNKVRALLRRLMDAFFAEEFITPASTDSDYKLTAALSKVLFAQQWKDTPDAISYPSVAFRAGYNFAIRPDAEKSKMRLLEEHTRIVKVKGNYSAPCSFTFIKLGDFPWNSSRKPSDAVMPCFMQVDR